MDGSVIAIPNEKALVARAKAEPEAFALIYDHYFPRIYNYIRYRIQDPMATDDITAQVFERALIRLDQFQPERGSLTAWLFSIARNAIIDHLRAEKRRRWLPITALWNKPGADPQPEQHVLKGEAHAHLFEALNRLGERERELVAMKFGARMTNRLIAEVTGLSENNVGVILYRSLDRLKRMLVEKEQDNG